MRIVQLLPVLSYGDAIGNDTLAVRDVIARMGYETGIYYTDHADSRLPADAAAPLSSMPDLRPDDILLYHACTGAPINFELPRYGGKKVMIYHNVTPPAFFHDFNPEVERIQEYAYEGIRFLSDKVDYCIADSEYNRRDLIGMGYRCPIDVCPIVIPYSDYDTEPDRTVMEKMRADGYKNLLFVGRIVPNKKQEDVIRAFYRYRSRYEEKSRLILIGSAGGMENYMDALQAYIRKLGLEDSVLFPGHIRFPEILAYYRTADVFVCMSEHEGFCVPLVEAMYFGKPVVALRAAAVPETLGQGGLLLDSSDPGPAAAAVDRILTDGKLREWIRKGQAEALERFHPRNAEEQMKACILRAAGMQKTAGGCTNG